MSEIKRGEWYYDGEDIYLYVPDGNNPSLHDIGVIEDNKYHPGIFLNHAQYVTIYGLTVKYAGGHGISILGSHNKRIVNNACYTIVKCLLYFVYGLPFAHYAGSDLSPKL